MFHILISPLHFRLVGTPKVQIGTPNTRLAPNICFFSPGRYNVCGRWTMQKLHLYINPIHLGWIKWIQRCTFCRTRDLNLNPRGWQRVEMNHSIIDLLFIYFSKCILLISLINLFFPSFYLSHLQYPLLLAYILCYLHYIIYNTFSTLIL